MRMTAPPFTPEDATCNMTSDATFVPTTFQFTNPTDGAGTYVLLVQADNLNTRSFYNLSTVLENENTNGPFITGDNQIVRAPVGSDIELFVLFNLQVPSPFTTGDVLNINVKIEN